MKWWWLMTVGGGVCNVMMSSLFLTASNALAVLGITLMTGDLSFQNAYKDKTKKCWWNSMIFMKFHDIYEIPWYLWNFMIFMKFYDESSLLIWNFMMKFHDIYGILWWSSMIFMKFYDEMPCHFWNSKFHYNNEIPWLIWKS